MKIYVASSWKNRYQPIVIMNLRYAGHDVYDFRNPTVGSHGFHWYDAGLTKEDRVLGCSAESITSAINHPIATLGFNFDSEGMTWAEACLLLLPSGRSAHLEAGYMAGQGKRVFVLSPLGELCEPELMYLLFTKKIFCTIDQVIDALAIQPCAGK
jgi:hypothetical protein